MTAKPVAWLLLPNLRVQNANAISGPFSWGFPAPSAFTGFVHALSRKLWARTPRRWPAPCWARC